VNEWRIAAAVGGAAAWVEGIGGLKAGRPARRESKQ
jgi:hypothetical protein